MVVDVAMVALASVWASDLAAALTSTFYLVSVLALALDLAATLVLVSVLALVLASVFAFTADFWENFALTADFASDLAWTSLAV